MILVTIGLFILGVLMIMKGGDMFVDSASWIAEVSGIPKFIIGATIVSIATTMPEITVSLMAAAQGKVDMAVGNAIGSVTANTGLIMGLAVFFMPCAVERSSFNIKAVILLIAALITVVTSLGGEISVLASCVLFVLLVFYIYENVRSAKREASVEDRRSYEKRELPHNIFGFIIGAALIVLGANLLVENGSELAALAGVPERIIAVTFIAVGTSLPELVTAITAIRKKQTSLSVGNIIGANIINLTFIMPMSSVIAGKPLPISDMTRILDMPACFIILVASVIPAIILKKLTRVQGAVLMAMYVVYIVLLVISI